MNTLSYMKLLNHRRSLQNLVIKLPLPLQERWRKEAKVIRENHRELTLSEFSRFVKKEADIVNDPVFSKSSDLINAQSLIMTQKFTLFRASKLLRAPVTRPTSLYRHSMLYFSFLK